MPVSGLTEQEVKYDRTGRLPGLATPPVSSRAALVGGIAMVEGLVAALVVIVAAVVYHLAFRQMPIERQPIGFYLGIAPAVGLIYAALSAVATGKLLERTRTLVAALTDAALAWAASFSVVLLLMFFIDVVANLSRGSFLLAFVAGLPLMLSLRSALHRRLMSRIRSGELRYHRVAVLGQREDVLRFLLNGHLAKSGYQLAGTLYSEDVADSDGHIGAGELVAAARKWLGTGVENIILVGDIGNVEALERVSAELKRFALNVICAPATSNTTFKYLDVVPVGANNALRFLRKPMGDGAVLLKRVFDIAGASFGLLLLSPLLLLVAAAIKLDSPGPVFFRQERRGFNGESFFIWKFRSMKVSESGHEMRQAEKGDDRITQVGRIIRPLSLDELPQLFNVLAGQMSLVGPRPHAIVHDDELGEQVASYAHRQRIKPGITGWAQVNGYRGETRTLAQVEGRTLHDLHYIDNWSLLLDCWIIVLTVVSSRTRRNAY